MTVQIVTTSQGLAELEAPWRALGEAMPFRSWDWLATWWKHYGAGRRAAERQLFVVAVYDKAIDNEGHSRLLGIAPWYLDRTAVNGNVLRWLGSGEVCTDHLSITLRPEKSRQVVQAIADRLTTNCDDWDRLDLSGVDGDDETVAELMEALQQRDCLVSRHAAEACWSLALPATWDDYLAGVSKSHRKQLRQCERRVLESGRVAWHRVESASDLDAAWRVLVDLHQRRRRSLGEAGCFASHAFHDFHREVSLRLLARHQLRMSWLELDGIPAAAEYHLADERATYAYQGGVDPDRLAEEPGRLSTILCLRQAIEEGHAQFDFLRGDEPYKAHWRAEPRVAYDYRVVPNRRLARLRGRVLTFSGAVREWMRQTSS